MCKDLGSSSAGVALQSIPLGSFTTNALHSTMHCLKQTVSAVTFFIMELAGMQEIAGFLRKNKKKKSLDTLELCECTIERMGTG